MKKKILLVFLIGGICLTPLIVGRQLDNEVVNTQTERITITDALDRKVSIPGAVKRVVTIGPSVREAFKVLHASDLIVGSDSWPINSDLFGEKFIWVNGSVDDCMSLDYEKIIELNPDVVIALPFLGIPPQDIINQLCPEITVVFLPLGQIDEVTNSFKLLGKILGKEKEAEEFIKFSDEILKEVVKRISTVDAEDRPKVLLKAPGASPDQFSSYTKDSVFSNTLITLTGGINLADNLPSSIAGWVEDVNQEWLIEQEIDIILDLIYTPFSPETFGYSIKDPSNAKEERENLINMEILKDSHAVNSNQVYILDSDFAFTLRGILGVVQIAKWFHPELFTDMDTKNLHQQYLTEFLQVDLDLNTRGLLYYPESPKFK